MPRRVRVLLFVILFGLAPVLGQTLVPTAAYCVIEESSPYPDPEGTGGGNGDEGGDADEVLIRTDPNRMPLGQFGAARAEARETESLSGSITEAPVWWQVMLQWLGLAS